MPAITTPILKSQNYLLRAFKPQDIHFVFQGLSDPEVVQYYGVQYDTLEATKAQMDFFQTILNEGTGVWWAITDINQGSFHGAIGINNLETQHRKAELGYWLLKTHWGKGIIQETAPLVLHYAFEQLGLHRLEAWVENDHFKSKKLLEKLGFKHEGTLWDSEIKNGAFISLDVFALRKP